MSLETPQGLVMYTQVFNIHLWLLLQPNLYVTSNIHLLVLVGLGLYKINIGVNSLTQVDCRIPSNVIRAR